MRGRRGITVTLGGLLLALASTAQAQEGRVPGAQAFQGKGCAQCHAVGGERGKAGPPVERLRRDQGAGMFLARLWGHLPAMRIATLQQGTTWPRLTPQEITELAAYLGVRPGADPYPNLSRGQSILVSGGCLKCHALAGEGARVGPDLSRFGNYDQPFLWAAAMWNHGPAMLDRANQMGIPFPALSPQDMVDLLGFLSAYKQTRP